jgi:hypothetical protein
LRESVVAPFRFEKGPHHLVLKWVMLATLGFILVGCRSSPVVEPTGVGPHLIPAPVSLSIGTTNLPQTTVGARYSTLLFAVGGNEPYAWVGSGVLGLTVSPAGLLSGTPTQSGTFIMLLTVADSMGATASTSIPVTVSPPLTAAQAASHSVSGFRLCRRPTWRLKVGMSIGRR